ncbi:hypothetical protein B0J14DRAFT_611300, partial [Halenospora varia]
MSSPNNLTATTSSYVVSGNASRSSEVADAVETIEGSSPKGPFIASLSMDLLTSPGVFADAVETIGRSSSKGGMDVFTSSRVFPDAVETIGRSSSKGPFIASFGMDVLTSPRVFQSPGVSIPTTFAATVASTSTMPIISSRASLISSGATSIPTSSLLNEITIPSSSSSMSESNSHTMSPPPQIGKSLLVVSVIAIVLVSLTIITIIGYLLLQRMNIKGTKTSNEGGDFEKPELDGASRHLSLNSLRSIRFELPSWSRISRSFLASTNRQTVEVGDASGKVSWCSLPLELPRWLRFSPLSLITNSIKPKAQAAAEQGEPEDRGQPVELDGVAKKISLHRLRSIRAELPNRRISMPFMALSTREPMEIDGTSARPLSGLPSIGIGGSGGS